MMAREAARIPDKQNSQPASGLAVKRTELDFET